jgi:hypothetical protein
MCLDGALTCCPRRIHRAHQAHCIKIWDKATGQVIYDNQMDSEDDADLDPSKAEIGGGSIVIHK